MISPIIKDLQKHLRSQLHNSFTILIAIKNVAANNYPFGSYKILRSEFEQPHQNIRTRKYSAADNVFKTKTYYTSKTVVQLNFYNKLGNGNDGDDSLDQILDIAQMSWMWLNEEGREKINSQGMVLSFTSPQITQEENLNHQDGLCRVGFDFTLKKILEYNANIEMIETISINGNKEDYTIELGNRPE